MSGAPLLLLMSGDPMPAFDLNFLGGMPAGLTYTNSSVTRTYFGSDGLLKTAAANEPIFEYNPTTLALLGMRWEMEQRTNLALRSADFTVAPWSGQRVSMISNQAVAPDGTTTADKLSETVDSGIHFIGQDVTFSAIPYTVSVFAKVAEKSFLQIAFASPVSSGYANFNLSSGTLGTSSGITSSSITSCGNGWFRCSVTLTTSAATGAFIFSSPPSASSARLPVYAGDGSSGIFLWGAQVEAAAAASSYIPTAGSAVIRQPDVLTATSISPWYRQDEGTVVFEGIQNEAAGAVARGYWVFSDGTNNNRIHGFSTAANSNFRVANATVEQALITTGVPTVGSVFRHAGAYKANSFASAFNGVLGTPDNSGSLPAVTSLTLGQSSVASNGFMGYARRFQYYNTRFPNSILQGLSRV